MGNSTLNTHTPGNGSISVTGWGWNGGTNPDYWSLDFSSEGYENLQITFKAFGSGTGPRDFKLQYFDGHELKTVTLDDYRGKQVVLAFYVFAFTGG